MAVENCFVYRSTMFGGKPVAPNAPPAPNPPARGAGAGATLGLPGGGFNRGNAGGGGSMALRAMSPDDGRIAWEIAQVGNSNNYGGTLATAGGLVFYGQASGEFAAVDAKSGTHLWHFDTHEIWKSSPITYMVNGKQYPRPPRARIFWRLRCRNKKRGTEAQEAKERTTNRSSGDQEAKSFDQRDPRLLIARSTRRRKDGVLWFRKFFLLGSPRVFFASRSRP